MSAPYLFGAGSELIELEEIQPISLQAKGKKKRHFPDLNDTKGKRVNFKYKFSNGETVRLTVMDGLVASGDMILSTYDNLIAAIKDFESGLAEGHNADELSTQAVFTRKFCKFRTAFCWDHDGAKWPDGIIYYEPPSTSDFPQSTINLIYDVMDEIEENTDIDFRATTDGSIFKNRIHFTSKNDGCNTWLGMAGGRQRVNLEPNDPVTGRGCQYPRVVRHELGHVMGLIHEHQRSDRGSSIRINTQNIQRGQGDQFDRWRKGHADQTTYDYDSIMHYAENSFGLDTDGDGISDLPTITALNGRTNLGGPVFTPRDLQLINRYY